MPHMLAAAAAPGTVLRCISWLAAGLSSCPACAQHHAIGKVISGTIAQLHQHPRALESTGRHATQAAARSVASKQPQYAHQQYAFATHKATRKHAALHTTHTHYEMIHGLL
jgi:hypothetical protein